MLNQYAKRLPSSARSALALIASVIVAALTTKLFGPTGDQIATL